jgi:thymidylate kinase
MRFIIVEGVIAAGKSALVEAVASALCAAGRDAVAVPEPVAEWESSGELAAFYRDPVANGLAFQLFAAATRARAVAAAARAHPGAMFVLERSAESDRLFFELLRRDLPPGAGLAYDSAAPLLTAGAFADARLKTSSLQAEIATAPVIFLAVPPTLAAERGAARARAAEIAPATCVPGGDSAAGGVSIAYLERLARAHDAMLFGRHADEFPSLALSPDACLGRRIIVIPDELARADFRTGGAARAAIGEWVVEQLKVMPGW